MSSHKNKREQLAKELERIGDHICELMDKLEEENLKAAEYCQAMAEFNIWKRRYDKVDSELMLLEVAPSKRTEKTIRNLKSKLV